LVRVERPVPPEQILYLHQLLPLAAVRPQVATAVLVVERLQHIQHPLWLEALETRLARLQPKVPTEVPH